MIEVTAPQPLHGQALADEIAAQLGISAVDVVLHSSRGVVQVDVGEDVRATVEQVAAGHVPPSPPPDPDDELEAALADAAAKTTVEEKVDAMLAALRGRSGRQGQVAGRRPE